MQVPHTFLDVILAQYAMPTQAGQEGLIEVVNTAAALCLVLAGSTDDNAKPILQYLGGVYKDCRGKNTDTIIATMSHATYNALRLACQVGDSHVSEYIEAIIGSTVWGSNMGEG